MNSLHIHSNYSMLSGGASVKELCDKQYTHGYSSIGLTDTDGMYGYVELNKISKEKKLKPVFGVQLTSGTEGKESYLIVIARNLSGYKELCSLITSRKLKDDFSLKTVVTETSKNLTYITPDPELLLLNVGAHNIYAEIRASKYKTHQNKHLMNLIQSSGGNYI